MSDPIARTIDALGPVGVGLLVGLESIIPPMPSELVLPLAGFRPRVGAMPVLAVPAAATLGSLAGGLVLYALGARLGYDRLHLPGRPPRSLPANATSSVVLNCSTGTARGPSSPEGACLSSTVSCRCWRECGGCHW